MDSPHRMSPEEAAAKADALIAQYRATTPRKSRASQPRISDLPSPKAFLGDRMKLMLVFVFACLAGYQLHAARFVSSAVLGGLAAWSAFALARRLRTDEPSSDRGHAR